MSLPLRTIMNRLDDWIPPSSAQPYDNVGLQVGDPDANVVRAIVALDLTPAILDEAIESSAQLIVTHHPLLFKGLKRIDTTDLIGNLVYRLVANGIAVVATHTNLDAAADGVSAKLAELLGLVNHRFLEPLESDPSSDNLGLGMIGELTRSEDLASFLQRVCETLKLPAVRYAGDRATTISSVAVCGGAGGDLVAAAIESGADAYVTADLSYHTFFEVLGASGTHKMALIDAGHYETESETEALLVDWLTAHLPDVDWRRTTHRSSPIKYHVAR